MSFLKWLYPGLCVKRWIMLTVLGAFFTISGTALLVVSLLPVNRFLLLQWGERFFGPFSSPFGAAVIFVFGVACVVWGLLRAFRSIVYTLAPDNCDRLIDVLYTRSYLKRGPKIVVVGGGTGLSVLLRGLKKYTNNITAIVAVTDDGGSSGRLRGDLGILAPGDIRNCLVALADKESLMENLLQYRFSQGQLAGHNLGNLLIAAMNELTGGFNQAVREMSKVLAIRGQVLPSTLENAVLGAELIDGSVVFGESEIPRRGLKIKRVFLKPERCSPLPEALQAIKEADAVVLGPGSLYTSILPNLLLEELVESIAGTGAIKIYICNIMTQAGETSGYDAADHVRAIIEYTGNNIDYVTVNKAEVPGHVRERYKMEGSEPVAADIKEIEKIGPRVVAEALLADSDVVRHDPEKLARLIFRLILKGRGGFR